MDGYGDLGIYNGDTEHNMWIDFDKYENIGITDVFESDNLDNFIYNLNDRD